MLSCSVMSNSLLTPWTVVLQALCPWDFPGKNTGVGKPLPSPGYLPNPGIKFKSPVLAGESHFTTEPPGFFSTEP